MNLIDFVFLDPRLHSDESASSYFGIFNLDQSRDQNVLMYELLALKKSHKTMIHAIGLETRLQIEEALTKKGVLSNYHSIEFLR